MESSHQQLQQSNVKANSLAKSGNLLEQHLAELQESLQEETKQKLAALSKVRQAEEEAAGIRDELEEEEQAKKALEIKINTLNLQVRGSIPGSDQMFIVTHIFC